MGAAPTTALIAGGGMIKGLRSPVLGDLEVVVMDHLWTHGQATVKGVYRSVGKARKITLNTVQSAMERLFRKRLLARTKVSHAYEYEPRMSRQEFGAELVRQVAANAMHGDDSPMLLAFVDLASSAGEETLDRLEQMIAERRRMAAAKQESDHS